MLTVEQCRQLDPRLHALTDAELTELRDALYEMADLACEAWERERGVSNVSNVVPKTREKKMR